MVGVTPNHLGRVFRDHTGVTFREYLLAARMFIAADLLRHAKPIKDVAAALGYSHYSNFCRDFGKVYLKRPASYRLLVGA
jgi:two-component system response regulator YesN